MKAVYTILLLIVSNVFMTFAWYGHLKMKQEYGWFASLPLIGVVAFSWSTLRLLPMFSTQEAVLVHYICENAQ